MKTDTTKKSYNGSRAIKIEDIHIGQRYALSINPQLQPNRSSKAHVYTWYRKMYEWLNTFRSDLTIKLYPEVSPLGRWHFHGSIVINSYIGYVEFVRDLNQNSHFEVDTIASDTSPAWEDYCNKQAFTWKKFFSDSLFGFPICIGKNYKELITPVQNTSQEQQTIIKFLNIVESFSDDETNIKNLSESYNSKD